jgi:deoxyribose-phosphate aldolase
VWRVLPVRPSRGGGGQLPRRQQRRAARRARHRQIVAAGAQEVDVVIPYRDLGRAHRLLAAVRRACEGLR